MKRGRKPTPTKLALVRGNPGKRRLPDPGVEPEPAKPKRPPAAPSWLRPYGKREWRRVARELHELGLLTRIDLASLEAYCTAYAQWREAEEWLQEEGEVFVVRDKDGNLRYSQPFPQVAIARQGREQCRKLAAEFGLTPSARRSLGEVSKEKDTDPLEALLARRKSS